MPARLPSGIELFSNPFVMAAVIVRAVLSQQHQLTAQRLPGLQGQAGASRWGAAPAAAPPSCLRLHAPLQSAALHGPVESFRSLPESSPANSSVVSCPSAWVGLNWRLRSVGTVRSRNLVKE